MSYSPTQVELHGQTGFTFHGKELSYSGRECGLYKQGLLKSEYTTMDFHGFISVLEHMPRDDALVMLEEFKGFVEPQLTWAYAPAPLGLPVIQARMHFEPVPLSDSQKQGIKNTLELTEQLLAALRGD